jgi:N4-gp56 family major capsid protein
MAVTTVQSSNKLIKYTQDINREFVRESLFSPYMGEDVTSIIRRRFDLKNGGEQMNIPLVTRLAGTGTGSGTLAGNEEKIDNYGMRVWLDWARHAVVTNKAEQQKDSAEIFGAAKPLLSDWIKELQRDETIAALMALPSESAPNNLGTASGQRVNGILYDEATAAQRNTWNADNSDRVLYGNATSNFNATHATALANCDTTNDKLTAANLALLKRIAMGANPKIRPFKTRDGYEYYVAFAGLNTFRDLKASLETVNKDARPREQSGYEKNPLFQDGDQIYDGVIVRQVPEISSFVTSIWTTLKTAGAASARVEPVFLCGQQAAVFAIGQMAKPTFRKEDDYGFITGTGIEMAYGVSKMFKKHPSSGTKLVQWGMATGFFATATD